MKISIFGTGYVGLVTGVCLAELGHEVLCIDVNKKKIENLKKLIIPIYEPKLEKLVNKNYKKNSLDFSTDPKKGITFGKIIFNAVGTPVDKNNKAELKYVYKVAKGFGKYINEYKLFVNKSTIPVGTSKNCKNIIEKEIQKRNKSIIFDIASNPEFLREGTAIFDFMNPDRIVCGVENNKSKKIMQEIYKALSQKTEIMFTDIASAEIIKYASNSFLATKISFINEISNFTEILGANIKDVSKGIGLDKRIGKNFLEAGIGYGGSCFPKDIKAFISNANDFNYDFKIIKATIQVNEKQKIIVIKKLVNILKNLKGYSIGIWGLSYKPNTDDVRDAPSIEVIKNLLKLGVKEIKAYDPVSNKNIKPLFINEKKVEFKNDKYECIKKSDALIMLTEWDEFKKADIVKMKNLMKKNIIIDGRNIWNKEKLEKLGFVYVGVG